MNVSEFATKVKQKYPQYNHISDYDLTQKMIQRYPQYKSQVTVTPEDKVSGPARTMLNISQGAGDVARGMGLGGAADILAASPGMQGVQKATGINPAMKSSEIPQRTMNTPLGQIPNPVTAGMDTLGAASWMLPGGKTLGTAALTGGARGEMYGMSQGKNPVQALPYAAGGAVLEPLTQLIGKALPYLTKKGTAGATEEAVQQSADKPIKWDNLEKQIRENVENRLGSSPEVSDAIDKLLTEKTPAMQTLPGQQFIGQPQDMTPEELLQWRRQISARGAASGILQNLFKGTNIEDKVNSVARDVISQNIHDIVPGTITPDKLYSLYSKLGGDVPQWATKLLAGWLADKTVGKSFGPTYEPLIDLGAGALAGRLPIP